MELSGDVSQTVVEQVAAAEGVEPTELGPPLARSVDPDALDSVFDSDAADGSISFEYCGYHVTVDQDGDVDVRERPPTER